jgi:hypothetical protein
MAKKDLVTYLANIVLVSSVDIYFISNFLYTEENS